MIRRYCQNCGNPLSRYNDGPLCYPCEEKLRSRVFETRTFEDITKADYFGYSRPRFREKEKAIGHIGTYQSNGREDIYTSVNGPQWIPLPAHSIFGMGPGSISGIAVKGSAWVSALELDRRRPYVVLQAQGTVP